jgi:excinuclease ABC subunit C
MTNINPPRVYKFKIDSISIEKIPKGPGIYFFIGPNKEILYIGKAANLQNRIRSYFSTAQNLPKIKHLLKESKILKIMPLNSEIEALIKEALFIKKKRPKYNILFRDDKNYFFVAFTKEKFPRIFITHQPSKIKNAQIIGPYVDGKALKTTLKLIRKIFPYCSCRKAHFRKCIFAYLNLCPGYCCLKNIVPNEEDVEKYQTNISNIKKILLGKNEILHKELHKKLNRLIKNLNFEEAAKVRDKLIGLRRIMEHRGIVNTFEEIKSGEDPQNSLKKLKEILKLKKIPNRIECYDASIISGNFAVGAMTVFIEGRPQKSEWRLFKMRSTSNLPNDPMQIKEMLIRRLNHSQWHMPDLIIVDGGKSQLSAASSALKLKNISIPVVAIAKGKNKEDRLILGPPYKEIPLRETTSDIASLLSNIRDETHRFTIRYHRKLRNKSLFALD